MDIDRIVEKVSAESIKTKKEFFSETHNVEAVKNAASAIVECYKNGGKVLIFGNGGSAADSQHFAAELAVRFENERKALPAIALTTDTSIITAAGNDYGFNNIFSRQIEALVRKEDIVVAISTSGNSENVLEGVRAAQKKKVPVIALIGKDGGALVNESDLPIMVQSDNTARIQEVHVTIIHILCKIVEDSLEK